MWAPTTSDLIRDREAFPTEQGAAPHKALGDTTALAAYHPDFAGPVRYSAIERPADDETATADTIAIMARMVREDSQDQTIRAIAQSVAAAGGDPVAAIHRWVRERITFKADAQLAATLRGFTPTDTEVLIRPVDLLRMPQPAGDCDDFSMLTAALLRAAGIPAAFVTIAADPAFPETYSHVYVMSGKTPVDSSHGPRAGWSAPAAGKSRTWEIDEMFTGTAARPQLGDTIWWQDLVKIGATAGADIAKMAATPTGYYQQIGPGGTSITTRQTSVPPFSMPSSLDGGGLGIWVIGGAALVALLLIVRK